MEVSSEQNDVELGKNPLGAMTTIHDQAFHSGGPEACPWQCPLEGQTHTRKGTQEAEGSTSLPIHSWSVRTGSQLLLPSKSFNTLSLVDWLP